MTQTRTVDGVKVSSAKAIRNSHLRAIFGHTAHTQTARVAHILLWGLFVAALTTIEIALLWGFATAVADSLRAFVDTRFKRNGVNIPYLSALTAMGTNSFRAAAPALVFFSGHSFAMAAALFLILDGVMLTFSRFRTSPLNAVIAMAPYCVVFCVGLTMFARTPGFVPMLATLPIMVASIYYMLSVGYHTQRKEERAAAEKLALIEDLKSARISAERASEAKSMFLANMSHEIRTPMNGVLGMAELLAASNLDSRQRIFVDTIHKSGGALLTIINDILDFSKIESGKLELDDAPFDLRAALEDVAALVASSAQEKDIEVIVRVAPELPTSLVGDGGRLRQVVTNLVGNAVKFTQKGHVLIDLNGEVEGDVLRFRLEVADTGIGISPAKQESIFNAFQQADATTTREFGGTGLGLSISSRLVNVMGGKIGVRSLPGAGSTFWIELTLPLNKRDEIAWQPTVSAGKQRVLIVDDIAVNRRILSEQLTSWGFKPVAVESAVFALEALAEAHACGDQFALAILDFHMPEIDGEELARRIRANHDYDQVPLMALTSVDGAGDAARFREIGVASYLVKPVRGALLYDAVTSVLQNVQLNEIAEVAVSAEDAMPLCVASSSRRRRILLAEDNEVNQLVVKHMLDPNDFDVVIVNDGREAVEIFTAEANGFDLVLMDVSMPDVDGYEATQMIRNWEGEADIARTPIICLTAHVMAHDVERAHEAGMDDFLSKPISKSRIDQAIEIWAPPEGATSAAGDVA